MLLGVLPGSRACVQNGRRSVLYPRLFIWSSMSRQLRAQSPCGQKAFVSIPNQLIPVILTGWPLASTIWLPLVCQNPAPLPTEICGCAAVARALPTKDRIRYVPNTTNGSASGMRLFKTNRLPMITSLLLYFDRLQKGAVVRPHFWPPTSCGQDSAAESARSGL